jgi:hypothetical protein
MSHCTESYTIIIIIIIIIIITVEIVVLIFYTPYQYSLYSEPFKRHNVIKFDRYLSKQ